MICWIIVNVRWERLAIIRSYLSIISSLTNFGQFSDMDGFQDVGYIWARVFWVTILLKYHALIHKWHKSRLQIYWGVWSYALFIYCIFYYENLKMSSFHFKDLLLIVSAWKVLYDDTFYSLKKEKNIERETERRTRGRRREDREI